MIQDPPKILQLPPPAKTDRPNKPAKWTIKAAGRKQVLLHVISSLLHGWCCPRAHCAPCLHAPCGTMPPCSLPFAPRLECTPAAADPLPRRNPPLPATTQQVANEVVVVVGERTGLMMISIHLVGFMHATSHRPCHTSLAERGDQETHACAHETNGRTAAACTAAWQGRPALEPRGTTSSERLLTNPAGRHAMETHTLPTDPLSPTCVQPADSRQSR